MAFLWSESCSSPCAPREACVDSRMPGVHIQSHKPFNVQYTIKGNRGKKTRLCDYTLHVCLAQSYSESKARWAHFRVHAVTLRHKREVVGRVAVLTLAQRLLPLIMAVVASHVRGGHVEGTLRRSQLLNRGARTRPLQIGRHRTLDDGFQPALDK